MPANHANGREKFNQKKTIRADSSDLWADLSFFLFQGATRVVSWPRRRSSRRPKAPPLGGAQTACPPLDGFAMANL